MPDEPARPVPGAAGVARRALADIVRDAVLGSYGVTSLAEPNRLARLRAALRLGSSAVRVNLRPDVHVDVWVTVAFGLPVAEVARQVDSAVRYGLQRAIGRPVGPIGVHVQGLAGGPFRSPAPPPDELADPLADRQAVEPPAAGPEAPAAPSDEETA